MQALKIAALLGVLVTGTAFAQSNPATTAATSVTPDNSTTMVAMSNTAPQEGTWVAPTGQAIAPKTRAEVYGELVHAEKDGQLAYLNSTVYAHP